MKDESWNIELLKVLGEIRLRECFDAVVARLHASHHSLKPPLLPDAFGNLGAGAVVAVEREGNVPVKLRTILQIRGSKTVEDRNGRASGIFVRLQHQRWH